MLSSVPLEVWSEQSVVQLAGAKPCQHRGWPLGYQGKKSRSYHYGNSPGKYWKVFKQCEEIKMSLQVICWTAGESNSQLTLVAFILTSALSLCCVPDLVGGAEGRKKHLGKPFMQVLLLTACTTWGDGRGPAAWQTSIQRDPKGTLWVAFLFADLAHESEKEPGWVHWNHGGWGCKGYKMSLQNCHVHHWPILKEFLFESCGNWAAAVQNWNIQILFFCSCFLLS